MRHLLSLLSRYLPPHRKRWFGGTLTLHDKKIAVHPCVIDGRPHIVYPKGLQNHSPAVFRQLQTYFSQRGYALKEDQRSGNHAKAFLHERRKLAPIILFTAGLLFESTVQAEINHHRVETNRPDHQIELRLIPNHGIDAALNEFDTSPGQPTTLSSREARQIFAILSAKYRPTGSDPDYIIQDFKQIANYYSRFPDIVSLLQSIQAHNWWLRYDADNWTTMARGNTFEIHEAVIHFDTRSAAQLRLNNGCKGNPVCIASPADALLHELLHAHSMLVNTHEFIAQGGMSTLMYPYQHEYKIIEKERQLYARMSRQDRQKRPYRVDHTGRALKTRCPTCIE